MSTDKFTVLSRKTPPVSPSQNDGTVNDLSEEAAKMVIEDKPDPFLITALNNPQDRYVVLKVDASLESFVKEETAQSLEFPQMSSYNRLIVHRLAQYYNLEHTFDAKRNTILLKKTAQSALPEVKVTELQEKEKEEEKAPIMRIMKRTEDGGNNNASGRNNRLKPQERDLTFEEREEAYLIARARIFNENQNPASKTGQQGPTASSPTGGSATPRSATPQGTPQPSRDKKAKADDGNHFVGWAADPAYSGGVSPRGPVVDPDEDPRWSRNAPLWRGPAGGISTQPNQMAMLGAMGMMPGMGMLPPGNGNPNLPLSPQPHEMAAYGMRSKYQSTIWQPPVPQGWQGNSGWVDNSRYDQMGGGGRGQNSLMRNDPPPGNGAVPGMHRSPSPTPSPSQYYMYGMSQQTPVSPTLGQKFPSGQAPNRVPMGWSSAPGRRPHGEMDEADLASAFMDPGARNEYRGDPYGYPPVGMQSMFSDGKDGPAGPGALGARSSPEHQGRRMG